MFCYREQYRSDAQALYQQQLLEATRGRGEFPPVRTFKPGQGASTNSVYQEMEQAQSWLVLLCIDRTNFKNKRVAPLSFEMD